MRGILGMKLVIRAQYRAMIRANVDETDFRRILKSCCHKAKVEVEKGTLMTATMCRYQKTLFLYMEYLIESENSAAFQEKVDQVPDIWFQETEHILENWPGIERKRLWVYMYPVFWFDSPQSEQQWERKIAPDNRCGRIALLYPEKIFSYVSHHQAIVEEGLLVGDRYQMISLHENILFSYFETPRDRELVNIRRSSEVSMEIEKWEAVSPKEHFYHFPEAQGANFLIIPTIFSVGKNDRGKENDL